VDSEQTDGQDLSTSTEAGSLAERLAGRPLREGTYRIADWADFLLSDNVGMTVDRDGEANPMFGYVATQCGIGTSVGELFEIAEMDPVDGPMLGSVDLVFHQQPRVGVEYLVTGEIIDLVRKEGRKTGPFDLLRFRERLIDPAGTTVVECTNVFVLPRNGGDGA
jgi:hypothetical protein